MIPAQVPSGDNVKVSVKLQNTGSRTGEEVVQLFMTAANVAAGAPCETKVREVHVHGRRFRGTIPDGGRLIQPGKSEISASGKQAGGLRTVISGVDTGSIQLTGSAKAAN